MTTHELAKLLLAGPDVPVSELPESVCRPLLEIGFDLGREAPARDENPFRADAASGAWPDPRRPGR